LVSLPYRGPCAIGVGETRSAPPPGHEEEPLTWPPPVTLRRAGSPAPRYGGNVWMRAPPENETGWDPVPSPGHINRPLHIGLRPWEGRLREGFSSVIPGRFEGANGGTANGTLLAANSLLAGDLDGGCLESCLNEEPAIFVDRDGARDAP